MEESILIEELIPRNSRVLQIRELRDDFKHNLIYQSTYEQEFPIYSNSSIKSVKPIQDVFHSKGLSSTELLKFCLTCIIVTEQIQFREMNEVIESFRRLFYSKLKVLDDITNNHSLSLDAANNYVLPVTSFSKFFGKIKNANLVYASLHLEEFNDLYYEVKSVRFPMLDNDNIRYFFSNKHVGQIPFHLMRGGISIEEIEPNYSYDSIFEKMDERRGGEDIIISTQKYIPKDKTYISKHFAHSLDAFQKNGFEIFESADKTVIPYYTTNRGSQTEVDRKILMLDDYFPYNIVSEIYTKVRITPKSFGEILIRKRCKTVQVRTDKNKNKGVRASTGNKGAKLVHLGDLLREIQIKDVEKVEEFLHQIELNKYDLGLE